MKKILIVDDQNEVREFLSDFFLLKGFEVVEAANGLKALDVFNKQKPDVAIVDVEMPIMDGLEFSKQILFKQKDFPIIIVSAFLEKYSKVDIKELGVKIVLQKPLDLNVLFSEVNKVLH